jgi:hypothetical protein
MRYSYITDKDFVPVELTGGNNPYYGNDSKVYLYQIIYGALHDKMSYEDVSDLVLRISKDQKNDIVKRFNLAEIRKEIKAIIDKLRKYESKDGDVLVIIPFTDDYERHISDTISLFRLVLFTIDTILEKGDEDFKLKAKPGYTYPVKRIATLFVDFLNDYMDRVIEKGDDAVLYWREIIIDEMIRRNIHWMPEFEYNHDFHYKSKLYNQPERFFETVAWGKRLRIDSDEETNDSDSLPNASSKKPYSLGETGIVYFMLKDIAQETIAKNKKKKIVSLINYYLEGHWDDDTTRSYVDRFAQFTPKNYSLKFYNTVKEALLEYKFDVPEVIEEGIKIKNREKSK